MATIRTNSTGINSTFNQEGNEFRRTSKRNDYE